MVKITLYFFFITVTNFEECKSWITLLFQFMDDMSDRHLA